MLNVFISGLSLGQAAPNISAFIRASATAYPVFEMIERNSVSKTKSKTALFATTIRDNILYGKDDAKLEEIMRAAELSEAITIINNLPDGFETRQVSDHSGILLLDEATSALDAESEKSMQEALDHMMDSVLSRVDAEAIDTGKSVSPGRLYSMIGPDLYYGLRCLSLL
ncbi:hypothetical protein V6N13_076865 [Hibiscus sabdariffa]